ncbi:hypothetical protein D9M70_640280 [compost metagenome]
MVRGYGCDPGYRAVALGKFVEDMVTRTEEILLASVEDQYLVNFLHDARSVRDHNNRRACGLDRADGCDQRVLTFAVEIGIWFVQDKECRIAVERPR